MDLVAEAVERGVGPDGADLTPAAAAAAEAECSEAEAGLDHVGSEPVALDLAPAPAEDITIGHQTAGRLGARAQGDVGLPTDWLYGGITGSGEVVRPGQAQLATEVVAPAPGGARGSETAGVAVAHGD